MALVPNIGFEYHVGSGWSVGGNCVFAWWKNEKKSFTQFATYDFGSDIKTCIGKQISTPHTMNSSTVRDGYYNLWSLLNNKGNGTKTKVVKTIYDPSPVGYCVPPPAAFSAFTYTGQPSTVFEEMNVTANFYKGFNVYCNKIGSDKTKDISGGIISIPASGYRGSNSTYVTAVEGAGMYWTVIPDNDAKMSVCMSVIVAGVLPTYQYNRTWAFAIRPVKEH